MEVGFQIRVDVRRRWFNINDSRSVGHHAGASRSPRTTRLQLNLLFIRKTFRNVLRTLHTALALLIQGKLQDKEELQGL